MGNIDRIKKINELIKELVAESLSRNIDKKYLATVTAVETSRDLKKSKVWISVFNDENEFLESLQGKGTIIKNEVAKNLFLKHTPHLEFLIDHSGEYAQRIQELLDGNK